jgi:hypothetical protein
MSSTFVKTTPRVEAIALTSDPKISIGIGEKGSLVIYGLGRFPVSLYPDQYDRLTKAEVIEETKLFIMEHEGQFGERKQAVTKSDRIELMPLTPENTTLLDGHISKLKAAGDHDGALKYNTIKQLAARQGGKLGVDDLMEVYQLKAKQ